MKIKKSFILSTLIVATNMVFAVTTTTNLFVINNTSNDSISVHACASSSRTLSPRCYPNTSSGLISNSYPVPPLAVYLKLGFYAQGGPISSEEDYTFSSDCSNLQFQFDDSLYYYDLKIPNSGNYSYTLSATLTITGFNSKGAPLVSVSNCDLTMNH